jgi:hypothetical protein
MAMGQKMVVKEDERDGAEKRKRIRKKKEKEDKKKGSRTL